MSTPRIFRNCLAACLMLLLAFAPLQPALAQEGATQVRITQVDTTNFPQVTVYLSVTDANGAPLGVEPDQILLYEEGQLVQPDQISGMGEIGPLTTLLVVDVSGSMYNGGKLEAAQQAAQAYIDQMRPGDQAGLISFNTEVVYVQPVTADRQALYTAIDSLVAQNDTAMFDALTQAIQALQPISGRKAIIVLTDGLDNVSASTLEDVIGSVGPGGLSISTIGLGDPAAGGTNDGIDEASLRDLAAATGGAYAFAADSAALQAIYQVYGRALQSEYVITYTSPSSLRDGVGRVLTASLGEPDSAGAAEAEYNPGGVLPEVAGNSSLLFVGILVGLITLIFLPALVGLLFRRRPRPGKSRIKLK
ncbi:MAG: VWA domain-containing protein [Anaerolineales bacterium]|nr:VWA domain-containing protein [Anaerolineales bacterium]